MRDSMKEASGRHAEELGDLQSDFDALAAKLDKKVEETEELKRALTSAPPPPPASSSGDALQIATLESDLETATALLEKSKKANADLAASFQKKIKENNDLANQLEAANQQIQTSSDTNATAASLAKKNLDLVASNMHLADLLTSKEKEVAALDVHKEEIDHLQQQLLSSQKEADIHTYNLQQQLEKSQKEATAQRAAASTDSKLVESLRAELAAASGADDSRLESLQAELAASAASLAASAASLAAAEASLTTVEATLSAVEASRVTAEASLAASAASLATAEASLVTSDGRAANLLAENSQQQSLETALRSEMSSLTEAHDALKTKVVQLKQLKQKQALSCPVPNPSTPSQAQIAFAEIASPNGTPYFSPTLTRTNLANLSSAPLSVTSLAQTVAAALSSNDVANLSSALQLTHAKQLELMNANALLLAKLQNSQHNIQVVARIRPLTSTEAAVEKPVSVEPLSATECGYFDRRGKEKSSTWKCKCADDLSVVPPETLITNKNLIIRRSD